MDLNFTPEEIAFRDEARHFFRTAVPESIRAKVAEGEGLSRDDMINSQRILNARGWATVNWPVEWLLGPTIGGTFPKFSPNS